MGIYKYIRESWKKPHEGLNGLLKERMIEWRQDDVTIRIDKPTRIDRARSLGYKAKEGIIVVRQRIPVSARMRESGVKGRRTKTQGSNEVIYRKTPCRWL